MTASANIKTPSMDLPLKPGKRSKKHAKQLQKKFTKVTLAQVPYIIVTSQQWFELLQSLCVIQSLE